MYKIAISDLDGTLLGPDHKISNTTKQSIDQWIQNDRRFVIATGRHYIEAKTIQDEIIESTYLISSNGARVHNKHGEIVLKQNLPADIATIICNDYFDSEIQTNLFTDQQWYANFLLPELTEMSLNKKFQCEVTNLKEIDKSDTIKIFFWGEREKLNIIYKALHLQFSDKINLTFSLDRCLEVMAANANKGSAITALLASKNLSVEQTIAFGDGMNDVEMLQVVGKPILMANSQADLLKALPDAEITKSSKENGVAIKLNSILHNAKNTKT
ncbi:Cof-type HAD-IIB family hydrolase [Psychromonas sp. RZ22]|uniref:Cof-type HAD-IIB family hydrolase n=1 Tax=Psychromonas algarum TaxID=2555643 RepID=UPI001067299B|nr:Cof-type HAD-IIB family hydrolase [Psychromonas sp. RZ22]TEW54561.1 Cof-type HAD-IIB family hydrolase [Psychromonas sp. RZ22]